MIEFASPMRKRNEPLTAVPTMPPTVPTPLILSYTSVLIAMATFYATDLIIESSFSKYGRYSYDNDDYGAVTKGEE